MMLDHRLFGRVGSEGPRDLSESQLCCVLPGLFHVKWEGNKCYENAHSGSFSLTAPSL